MRGLYGAVLAVSAVALVGWIVALAIADSVAGWAWLDPERRLGRAGRQAVAGGVGFGMAGLSASFAGWPAWAALGAALGGTVAAVWYAGRLGPEG